MKEKPVSKPSQSFVTAVALFCLELTSAHADTLFEKFESKLMSSTNCNDSEYAYAYQSSDVTGTSLNDDIHFIGFDDGYFEISWNKKEKWAALNFKKIEYTKNNGWNTIASTSLFFSSVENSYNYILNPEDSSDPQSYLNQVEKSVNLIS